MLRYNALLQEIQVQEVQSVLSISNLLDIFFRVLERGEDVMAELRVLSVQPSGIAYFFALF
jgi:hypothetical protein